MIKIPTPLVFDKYKSIKYLNIPCGYDIETSSFYDDNNEKTSIVYSHFISINGEEHLFRHTEDFISFLDQTSDKYNLENKDKHMVIYVHNLAYEFQFIKHYLDIDPESVFAIGKKRKIVKFNTHNGFEFRCSHILTNKSLANWAKDLGMKKMQGDLNYELIRHPHTPLTPLEIGYIEEDVRIIIKGISELLKKDNIASIPMTSTGFIRRSFRKHVNKDIKYTKLLTTLTMETREYNILRHAFSGGDTRANVYHAFKTLKNVKAWDENSAYPGVQIMEKFPMSKGVKHTDIKTLKDIQDLKSKDKGILMTIELANVETKRNYTIISDHKCVTTGDVILDNGRIVYADNLITSITDVDLETYMEYYNFDIVKIGVCYVYDMDYLPTPYVGKILDLFEYKTTLDGIPEYEYLYKHSKGELNGVYGQAVSTPIYADTYYDPEDGVVKEIPLDDETLYHKMEEHNQSKNRFLFYPWGVWTTAYARRDLRLLNIALEDAGIEDYYCDTDSRYIENTPLADEIVAKANDVKLEKLKLAMKHHGFKLDRMSPKTPKGVTKTICLWSLDGVYEEFKTLGAKRYMCYKPNGDVYLTVSGLNKKAGRYIDGAGGFDYFTDNMYIPDFISGRKTSTYIDLERKGVITDYTGIPYDYDQKSGIHLERNSFKLTITPQYHEHVMAVQNLYQNKTIY